MLLSQHVCYSSAEHEPCVIDRALKEVAGNMEQFDIIIVGGGIAGVSAGYELAQEGSVLILEKEEYPGQHATGRSAAVYAASYGSDRPALLALSKASAAFFEAPPEGFCEHPLIGSRGVMYVAHEDKLDRLRESFEQLRQVNRGLRLLDEAAIREKMPALRSEFTKQAIYEEQVYDVDVHGLQEGYLKGFRQRGGEIRVSHAVDKLDYIDGQWTVTCGENSYRAPVIINAAGAWADKVAELAAVAPVGLKPLRRTAILVDPPEGITPDGWPMVVELEEEFYIKPDAGKVLVSPADETLSPPCDAQPEEIDVAYAAHYAETAMEMKVRQVDHSWSGLRSFVDDRNPVIGYAADAPGFFWLAAQGGYGIQTAPAAARLAASLVIKRGLPMDIAELGLTESAVSPARLEVESCVA